jgi:signal transduction histidine kinase
MKRITIILLFSMILFSSVSAQSNEEKKVAANVEALHKAMIDPDKLMLDNLIANELSYGHSSGKMDTKTSFLESVITGVNDYKTIDITDQTITISGKVALVRHTFNAEIATNGKSSMTKLGILLIWQKQHHKWRLLARQAFKL